MSLRTAFVSIAWLTAVAGALLALALPTAASFGGGASPLVFAGLGLAIVSDATVGTLITLRRPGNVVGLVLMVAPILTAATVLGWVSGDALAEQRGPDDIGAGIASLIGAVGFTPSVLVGGPLLALLFPDGRLPGPRWRWPTLAIVAAITIGSAAALVHPGPIPASAANNPLGVSGLRGSEAVWTVAVILILGSLAAALLLALAAVIVRLRRSEGVEQAQLKWFVAAIVAVCACVTLGFADGGYLGLAEGASPTGFDLLAYASQSLPPIAVGVAVLRYHLFEIDRIISRTLSWAMLTGLLGAVFIGLVVGLQAVFANVTRTNTLAVAASTLVVAALFQPLRRGIQSAVDRRFNRSRYDAERTVAEFATRLRNEVEITTVTTDLHGTVLRAVNPSSLGLWIREARP